MADPIPNQKGTVAPVSKSASMNAAIARAQGQANKPPPPPMGDVAAMFKKFDPAELVEMAKSGQYEFAPQLVTLEPDMRIEGILEGEGPGNDFFNAETGEVRHVASWIISSPDGSLRVSILSSAQLDVKLPPFVGGHVIIARQTDIKLAGGHRCGNYMVGGQRREDGKRRSWAKPLELGEGAIDVLALPAGAATDATATQVTNGANAPAVS